MRVVVIDDSEDCAVVLGKLVEHLGCEVKVYHHGFSAVRDIPRIDPHVVFLDITMPDMDGYEVAKELRGDPKLDEVYLVAFTGRGYIADRLGCLSAGFNDFLLKPVELERIAEIICAIAEERRLHVPGCQELAAG